MYFSISTFRSLANSRSSRSEVFCKKRVFNHGCNVIEKETLAQVFSCETCKIRKNIFFYRTAPVTASVIGEQTNHPS